jgi:hypothetical protein
MAKPKLGLIPAAQGSKLFSVLPSSGVGDFDFSRSGKATRINSQGLIEEVSNGQSRLNYPMIDGKVVGCPHHILEPQRTNVFTYSEDFNSGAPNWVLYGGSTVNSNNAISPDGTLNADKLSDAGGIYSQQVYNPNIKYVFSLFIKKNTATGFHMNFVDQASGYLGGTIVYTYSTNSIQITQSANSSISAESLDYGNGWIRLIMKFTTNVAQNYNYQAIESIGGDSFIWGAQLEQGSYPTSYIKSDTGSATTRSAETANGSGDAATFNDSEGVLMAEISALDNDGTFRHISISDGTNSNIVQLRYRSTPNVLQSLLYVGGVGEVYGVTLNDVTTSSKAAIKYKENDVAFWVDGFKRVVDTSASSFSDSTLNTLRFQRGDGGGSSDFYGNTKQLQYYDSALTDSEIEQLTSWTSFSDMAEGQLYTIE